MMPSEPPDDKPETSDAQTVSQVDSGNDDPVAEIVGKTTTHTLKIQVTKPGAVGRNEFLSPYASRRGVFATL